MYMQENIQCYLNEKEKREKRLEIYAGNSTEPVRRDNPRASQRKT